MVFKSPGKRKRTKIVADIIKALNTNKLAKEKLKEIFSELSKGQLFTRKLDKLFEIEAKLSKTHIKNDRDAIIQEMSRDLFMWDNLTGQLVDHARDFEDTAENMNKLAEEIEDLAKAFEKEAKS